jgi:hypothetical protein
MEINSCAYSRERDSLGTIKPIREVQGFLTTALTTATEAMEVMEVAGVTGVTEEMGETEGTVVMEGIIVSRDRKGNILSIKGRTIKTPNSKDNQI